MLCIFLDIETSGLDPYKHRAFELAFKIIDPFTGELKSVYETIIKQPKMVWDSRDLMSIEINGFTEEKLLKGKEESKVREEIISKFQEVNIQRGQAVFICQNPAFDRAFFSQIIDVYTQEKYNWPYHWLDLASMFWALSMKKVEKGEQIDLSELQLSKNSIAKYHGLLPESTPHGALNGVNHLLLCYEKVVGFPFKSA